MSEAGHVDTDLVGTARFQLTFDVGETGKTLKNTVMSDGTFPVGTVDCHFFAVNGMSADGGIYGTFIFFEISPYNCTITAVDGMLL